MSYTNAVARVTITIEIDHCGGAWGGDCAIEQLYKQAADSAKGQIARGVVLDGVKARVIGEPRVVAIIAERDR